MSDPSAETSVPAESERQNRARLATAIEARLKDIEARWLWQVQRKVVESDNVLAPMELRDAIGAYLVALAQALRGEASTEAGGTAAWVDVAREHALTRVRQGFNIEQLVHEFILLRRVLFEVGLEG